MNLILPFVLFVALAACDGVLENDAAPKKINTACGDVTSCAADGCCPTGCSADNDPDCSASCGNGVIDDKETCDGNCPASCDDGNACTAEVMEGSASNCSAACVTEQIIQCVSGDGCCADGCTEANDSDCGSTGCDPAVSECVPDCGDPNSWPQDWGAFEAQVVQELNQVRAQGADCGQFGNFEPTGPLESSPELSQAARCHSGDMADNNFFDHSGSNGSSFSQRIQQAGFQGSPAGENIAAGHGNPQSAVAGWVDSDGHCRNLMNPNANRVGVGFVSQPGTDWTNYWTMVTGAQ